MHMKANLNNSVKSFLMVINLKKCREVAKFFVLLLLMFSSLNSLASAQVSVTLGMQELYDDNIFLENDKRRPAPFVLNDNVIDDLRDGHLSTVPSDSQNGKPDSDILSNLFIDFSGKPKSLTNYIDSSYQLRTGLIIFGTFSEQNRITLDGNLRTNLADKFLPKPYYIGINNALQSSSNNLSVAGGTATQTAENYVFSAETGVSNISLAEKINFDFGYTGSYQKYLGELLLSDNGNSNTQTALSGVDFHSHILSTNVKDQLTKDLEIGLLGSGGVQIFTNIDNPGMSSVTSDKKELDRNNAELQGTTKYTISKKLSFDGSAGIAYSQLRTDPIPRTIEFLNDMGETVLTTYTPNDANTGLTYSLALNYAYRPGSILTVGSNQGFATNIDGQRLTSRTFFANLVEPLTERLKLTIGSRYFQFNNPSINITGDTNRFEGSASFTYNITQNTSFNLGYNYTKQDGAPSFTQDTTGFSEQDYIVNRFFIGVNTGFVGLPL